MSGSSERSNLPAGSTLSPLPDFPKPTDWHSGDALEGPVYLDANVLVGGLVSSHNLYPSCALVLGELLSSGVELRVSDLVVAEAVWSLAGIAHKEARPTSTEPWKATTYKAAHFDIMRTRESTVRLATNWIAALSEAGVMSVVDYSTPAWLEQVDRVVRYMRDFRLLPQDATHLAIAEAHAATFVTADRDDYKDVSGRSAPKGLAIRIVRHSPVPPAPSAPVRAKRAARPGGKRRRSGHH